MRSQCAAFDPADMQCGRREIDLVPAKVQQFGHPQTMPPSSGGTGIKKGRIRATLRQPKLIRDEKPRWLRKSTVFIKVDDSVEAPCCGQGHGLAVRLSCNITKLKNLEDTNG